MFSFDNKLLKGMRKTWERRQAVMFLGKCVSFYDIMYVDL